MGEAASGARCEAVTAWPMSGQNAGGSDPAKADRTNVWIINHVSLLGGGADRQPTEAGH
jgi:hypothetical protein